MEIEIKISNWPTHPGDWFCSRVSHLLYFCAYMNIEYSHLLLWALVCMRYTQLLLYFNIGKTGVKRRQLHIRHIRLRRLRQVRHVFSLTDVMAITQDMFVGAARPSRRRAIGSSPSSFMVIIPLAASSSPSSRCLPFAGRVTSVHVQELLPEVLPGHQVDEKVGAEVEVVDLLEHLLHDDLAVRDQDVEEVEHLVSQADDGQGGLQDEQ